MSNQMLTRDVVTLASSNSKNFGVIFDQDLSVNECIKYV